MAIVRSLPEMEQEPMAYSAHNLSASTCFLVRLLRVVRRLGLLSLLPFLAAGCGWNAKSQNAAGVRMYQQGFYPGAQQRFQQAIYNDPTNGNGYYNMAATLHKMGRVNQSQSELDQAESFYNQCLDHSPNHRDCYRGLAVLLSEEGRAEESFRLIQGWSMRSPALPDPKIELARLHQEYGDKEAAKTHLLEALTVDPNNARALAALGKIHEENGNLAQALSDYQRSLMSNQRQPEVAARVALLQPTLTNRVLMTPTGSGTRTVLQSQPVIRQ
jgi:tetratricopeptide (TPR) repeat protein